MTIFCTQSKLILVDIFLLQKKTGIINTSNLTSMLTSPNQFLHNMSKIKTKIPASGAATHVETRHLTVKGAKKGWSLPCFNSAFPSFLC